MLAYAAGRSRPSERRPAGCYALRATSLGLGLPEKPRSSLTSKVTAETLEA